MDGDNVGITTAEIKNFISKHGGNDMNNEFLGIYAADELKGLKKLKSKLNKEKHTVPFCIVNTDPINLPGEHWVAVINVCPDTHLFLFDSYRELGFRTFMKSDDEEIIDYFLKKLMIVIMKVVDPLLSTKVFNLKLQYTKL